MITNAALPGPALLFCPANRPDRFAKALARADVVVLDLEDAVAEVDKSAARRAILHHPLDPARVAIRINPVRTRHHDADLDVVQRTSYRLLMLSKCESPEQADSLADSRVIALCETPRGVLNAAQIASAGNVVAVMWGAEDLISTIGGWSSRGPAGVYRDIALHARSQVLLGAAAAGCQAIDSVFTDIADTAGLARESEDAVASGFSLKGCIHPSQVEIVRASFRPTSEQLEWARKVIGDAEAGAGRVTAIDGQMIDTPFINQAHAVLRAAMTRSRESSHAAGA